MYTDYFFPSISLDLGNGDRDYLDLPEELQLGCNSLVDVDGVCPIDAGDVLTYERYIHDYLGNLNN